MKSDQIQTVRGIIHCHSDFSFDGQNSLEELCLEFKRQGFDFMALTEHSQGITREAYKEFVSRCKVLSSEDFVVIPGLEILCPDGTEIAGVGLYEVIEQGSPDQVIAAIKKAGGFAIWVHPKKRKRLPDSPYPSHAIELLNGKEDGTVAPDLMLLHKLMNWRRQYDFFTIMGLDLHALGFPLNVWILCQVSSLSADMIVKALLQGEFSSHATRIDVPSSGAIGGSLYLKILLNRMVYVMWNGFLDILPSTVRQAMIALTRPLVSKVKQSGLNN